MANNLYNSIAQTNPFEHLVQQAQELRKIVANPKAEVQRLLSSGQMSQAQFNSFAQIAQQALPFFK